MFDDRQNTIKLTGSEANHPTNYLFANAVAIENLIHAADVLKRMAEVEVEGMDFYAFVAETTPNPELRDAAQWLADAERRHFDRFMEYAQHYERYVDKRIPFDLLPEEIRHLFKAKVFPAPAALRLETPPPADAILVQHALRAERASAAFVEAFKPYIKEEHQPILDQVAKEELTHAERLERFQREHFQSH